MSLSTARPQYNPSRKPRRTDRRDCANARQRKQRRHLVTNLRFRGESRVEQELLQLRTGLLDHGLLLEISYETQEFTTDVPQKGGKLQNFRPDFAITLRDLEGEAERLEEGSSLIRFYVEVTTAERSPTLSNKISLVRSVRRLHQQTVVLIGPKELALVKRGLPIQEIFPMGVRKLINERLAEEYDYLNDFEDDFDLGSVA